MLFGAEDGTGTRVRDAERRWGRELDALHMKMENGTRSQGECWRKLQESTHGPYLDRSANSTLHSDTLESAESLLHLESYTRQPASASCLSNPGLVRR
jgi:hypothetical protein